MLQINTGKLFTRAIERENSHRGLLYTNVAFGLARGHALEGPLFGRLVQTTELSGSPKSTIYEFTERMESTGSGPGFLVSHGADPYLRDMAVVFSFALNCICAPEIDVVRRLTSGQRSLSSGVPPGRYIRRVFDEEIRCQPNETDVFVRFLTQLLGLKRKTYLGVMRAIRTYVTGLHRVADDLELAYTLMVAACESLAQEFDGHEATWQHVADEKRVAIDRALKGAPDDVAKRVRDTIVDIEHTALARRFQGFVTANINASYFRTGFSDHPIGRSELPEALSEAYKARSKYVHQLRSLPDSVTVGHGFSETVVEGRRKMLTLQGLSRLIRHVIMTFVEQQPRLDKEPYDYHRERAGVVQVRLAPNYWVGNAGGDISEAGRDKFEGFLEELAGHLLQPDAKITNLTDVLSKLAVEAPNMKVVKRLPYLALHAIYSALGPGAVQMPTSLEAMAMRDLGKPSSESLVVHALFGQVPAWTLDEHRKALQSYRDRRGAKSGIRFPRLFETAIALELAERYRLVGDLAACKACVADAADDFPESSVLRAFAETVDVVLPLQWREILLPRQEHKAKLDVNSVELEASGRRGHKSPKRRAARTMKSVSSGLRRRRPTT